MVEQLICPITTELMIDPVIDAAGHTYERACIERWFSEGHVSSPTTGARLHLLAATRRPGELGGGDADRRTWRQGMSYSRAAT